jgi:hypothetical protein
MKASPNHIAGLAETAKLMSSAFNRPSNVVGLITFFSALASQGYLRVISGPSQLLTSTA